MSFIQEFKEFAMKGNVVDLAVGVIIGGAFQKIVDSLVKDLLMPVLGKLLGGVDRAIVPTRHTPPQNIVHLHSLTHPLFTAAESV